MPRIRTFLLCLGLSNLGCALIVVIASSAIAGLSYTVITSTYHELDANGVINQYRLGELWGAEYVSNWHNVVQRLVGEPVNGLYRFSYLPAGLLVLNGVILIVSWWRVWQSDRALAGRPRRRPTQARE